MALQEGLPEGYESLEPNVKLIIAARAAARAALLYEPNPEDPAERKLDGGLVAALAPLVAIGKEIGRLQDWKRCRDAYEHVGYAPNHPAADGVVESGRLALEASIGERIHSPGEAAEVATQSLLIARDVLQDSPLGSLADDPQADARLVREIGPERLAESPLSPGFDFGDPFPPFGDGASIHLRALREGGPDWREAEALLADAVLRLKTVAPGTQTQHRPELRMVSDVPEPDSATDALGFNDYANALAGLIENPGTETPFTIAINAPWGSGKSTLALKIKRLLTTERVRAKKQPYIICDFNAWMHDNATDLSGAFAAEIARTANRHRTLWQKARSWPARNPKTIQLIASLVILAIVLAALLSWIADVEILTAVLDLLGIKNSKEVAPKLGLATVPLLAVLGALIFAKIRPVGEAIGAFIADPVASANRGELGEVRHQLTKSVLQATKARGGKGDRPKFVIFVDDIERVHPPQAIDVLEVISQLLAEANVVTILLGDMPAVAACAGIKYKDLASSYDPGSSRAPVAGAAQANFGRLYLQKIIQLQFDIPPHSPVAIQQLVSELVDAPAAPAPTSSPEPAGPKAVRPKANSKLGTNVLKFAYAASAVLCLVGFVAMVYFLIKGNWAQAAVGFAAWLGWSLAAGFFQDRTRSIEASATQAAAKEAVGEAIRSVGEGATTKQIDQAVRQSLGEEASPAVIAASQAETRKALSGETEELKLAHQEAMKYLSTQPRGAKRLLNSLRVMLFVYRERGLVPGKISADQVGKWAALRERWPTLAQIAILHPALLKECESAAQDGTLVDRLTLLCPDIGDSADLDGFFKSSPSIGTAAPFLVAYPDQYPPELPEVAREEPIDWRDRLLSRFRGWFES